MTSRQNLRFGSCSFLVLLFQPKQLEMNKNESLFYFCPRTSTSIYHKQVGYDAQLFPPPPPPLFFFVFKSAKIQLLSPQENETMNHSWGHPMYLLPGRFQQSTLGMSQSGIVVHAWGFCFIAHADNKNGASACWLHP